MSLEICEHGNVAESCSLCEATREGYYRGVVAARQPCARDSDWCDGVICRENGIDCPNADPTRGGAMTTDEILDRERQMMGRDCEFIDAVELAEQVVVVVYRTAPLMHMPIGGKVPAEVRAATWADGRHVSSGIVRTDWVDA